MAEGLAEETGSVNIMAQHMNLYGIALVAGLLAMPSSSGNAWSGQVGTTAFPGSIPGAGDQDTSLICRGEARVICPLASVRPPQGNFCKRDYGFVGQMTRVRNYSLRNW